MIIQLDWFGCEPRSKWEALIHQHLEQFATSKNITRAQVRVEQHAEAHPPYRISLLLNIPGPDIASQGSGSTFDEALLKLVQAVRRTITLRAMKSREDNGAAKGVKAMHRG
jgi:hypothetical protein